MADSKAGKDSKGIIHVDVERCDRLLFLCIQGLKYLFLTLPNSESGCEAALFAGETRKTPTTKILQGVVTPIGAVVIAATGVKNF